MANKNKNLIIAYFPSREKAEQAAEDLKNWDQNHLDIKLGGMGIITADEDGSLKTHKVGGRAAGTGAKWGVILGAVTGILSGGLTLIGGAIAGLAAGTVAGALFHKRIGMSDADQERLVQYLKDGGAALAVMADDEEVDPAKFQLKSQGGDVESYHVPDDALDELEASANVEGVEELDEVAIVAGEAPAEKAAAVGAAAVVTEAVLDEDEASEAEVAGAEAAEIEAAESAVPEAAASTDFIVDEEWDDADVEEPAAVDELALDEQGNLYATTAFAAAVASAARDDEESAVEAVAEEAQVEAAPSDTMGEMDPELAVAAAAAAHHKAESAEAEFPQTAVLHFRRYNDDYHGWGMHVWTGYAGQVSWNQPLPPRGMDDFGLVFEVPLAEGAEGLAYIIHRGDEKDQFDDQYLNFAENGREVWIVQNMPGYVKRP